MITKIIMKITEVCTFTYTLKMYSTFYQNFVTSTKHFVRSTCSRKRSRVLRILNEYVDDDYDGGVLLKKERSLSLSLTFARSTFLQASTASQQPIKL